MPKGSQGQKRSPTPRRVGRREDASLYGLSVEDAIRATLATGPHPKEPPAAAKRPNRKKAKDQKDGRFNLGANLPASVWQVHNSAFLYSGGAWSRPFYHRDLGNLVGWHRHQIA